MIWRFSLLLLVLFVGCCMSYSSYRSTPNRYSIENSANVASASQSFQPGCCVLTKWTYDHINEVRQFAQRLRTQYNNISKGNTLNNHEGLEPWNEDIVNLTGKSASELDSLSRFWAEKVISDMRDGFINYSVITKPNFFEFRAAEILQNYSKTNSQLNVQESFLDAGHFQLLDLSDFDEVKNYAYPAEVKVINGKTFVVHKNCTEATKTMGEGTFVSPLITVLKRNRTIISNEDTNYPSKSYYVPPGITSTSTTVSHKTNIYDWVNSNIEPGVVGYNPTVNIGSDWSSDNMKFRESYKATDISSYRPESTMTVHRYNQTVIRNSDGSDVVQGSETKRKWVDGHMVYDESRPFGDRTVPRDEAWKREERERLFWILSGGTITTKILEKWQHQQEERLLAMGQRYQISVDTIQNWHYQELDRFLRLLNQYYTKDGDRNNWRYREQGRMDWLIHQNSMSRYELERWQQENEDKLRQLAMSYMISLDEMKSWQTEELERLYIVFQEQNNSMVPSGSLHTNSEQERLDTLIREHNATISQLQNSIHLDQQRLNEIRQNYHGNVQDIEKWLKSELARLGGIITEQRNELTRVTEWQNSERLRLEDLLKAHRGSVAELETQMISDRRYIQLLASKYHISIEELEKWQKAELDRLQTENQNQMEINVKAWQAREHENLMAIIKRNDLTIEEFQSKIMNDRTRLEDLARLYKVQVSEVEDWFKEELKNFQSQGLLKEVEKEMVAWQQKERERLQKILLQNNLSIADLQKKINTDQNQLYSLANTYQIQVEELEEWLKKEFERLQSEGLVKVDDLKDWQLKERDNIMTLVQQNKLTIEEFEQKMLKDREKLQKLSIDYNVQRSEVEAWIRQEGKRLQQLGLLEMQEQLNQWQKIERERLLSLINKNRLTFEELESRLSNDKSHLYSVAHQNQVRVEEIEDWIRREIKKLQEQGLLEMAKLKDWQTEWRGNLTNMVQERDFTVEEFHKWLLQDRNRLQVLAKTHNVQIEEMEEWIRNEEQRFVSLGLLKPNEKLTNWQEVERRYLERITQEQQYRSTEQLEQRLRQDRELLEQLARQYSVQVEEIQIFMKKELSRLHDEGQLQIDSLTAWQLAERERLQTLTKAKKQWNTGDLEATLRKDREHMQKLAFQYHTSIEEIENWLKSEINRLKQQGKIEIKNLTTWQQAEQDRIMNLLKNQSSITATEFERKVQQDYVFLQSLANQYHVNVMDVESYVKNVIEELRQKGKFEVQNLQSWQLVERDYIKQFISQYSQELSTTELEQKLRGDRAHLEQLSAQYRINVDEVEKWMIEELKRLKNTSQTGMQHLSNWQTQEVERLKILINNNQELNYVTYEMELMKERTRLLSLAQEYELTIDQIEAWLRQQLLNLKTSGQIEVESLTKWQVEEQNRLIELLSKQKQNSFTINDFETQLIHNQTRLQQLAQEYSLTVEQIEHWMRNELQRLQNSGLVQIEHLNSWQKAESEKLEQWLQQLHHNVSYSEVLEFLQKDERHLHNIAREYQITVEEVESWVQLEAARLQFLNTIKQPDRFTYEDEKSLWKVHTRARLRGIAQAQPMSWKEFEKYLEREKMRWRQLALEYNVAVEEIEEWLRQSANQLQAEGIIQDFDSSTKEEWQITEQAYIQNLINEALRGNRQQWSIEELEYWLVKDLGRLRKIAKERHLTISAIESWYKEELQRLLKNRKIISNFINDWQRHERERIYGIVLQQPLQKRTYTDMETLLLQNQKQLSELALNYHITKQELVLWIIKELRRLDSLGILSEKGKQFGSLRWQQVERNRLRTIVSELIITEREVLEFIAGDNVFQEQLSQQYGCSLDQLAPFQRIEISTMQKEQLLENRNLLVLQPWQIKERDRIYSFIKNQNLTLKNLRDWQRQDIYINELAAKYSIAADTLKNWQVEEFERLIKLSAIYQMSLYQLQDFREKELLSLKYVFHKKLSSLEEREDWRQSEVKRLQTLQRNTGLSDAALANWRRKLYLLCQGLIPLDSGVGGQITGPGSTNVTTLPSQNISKDRGDQPPHTYDENFDSQEPGLEGQGPSYPSVPAQLVEEPSTTQRITTPYLTSPPAGMQSGYRYTKHEYKFSSAPIAVATASASANSYGSSASASIGGHAPEFHSTGHLHGRRDSDKRTNEQQEKNQEVENFGQQQQQLEISEPFNGAYIAEDEQQRQQFEDFGQQQQQLEVEYFKQPNPKEQTSKTVNEEVKKTATIVEAEPEKSSESNGFWNNLKNKTTDLFG